MIGKSFGLVCGKAFTIWLCVLLTSCSGQPSDGAIITISPASTEEAVIASPLYTDTPISIATKTPIPTDIPTGTTVPSPTPETIAGPDIPPFLIIPSGMPDAAWREIPIMHNAIAGLEAYGGYIYSIEKPVDEVQDFYKQELGNIGWHLAAVGEADNGSLNLVFQNNGDQVSLSLFNMTTDYEDPIWGYQAPASIVLIVLPPEPIDEPTDATSACDVSRDLGFERINVVGIVEKIDDSIWIADLSDDGCNLILAQGLNYLLD